MFTASEKKYLAMTAALLITGGGLKAYRVSGARTGPFSAAGLSGPLAVGLPRAEAVPAAPDSAAPDSALAAAPLDSTGREAAVGLSEGREKPGKTGNRRRGSGSPKVRAPVRLNEVEAQALVGVPGIGEKTALAIVAYRRAHGPFRELEDLLKVKGIGEKKLEKMRPLLLIGSADTLAP